MWALDNRTAYGSERNWIRDNAGFTADQMRLVMVWQSKYLGWSGVDFARHAGVDSSTVSNWETDKDPIGPSSDRLLRLMVVQKAPIEDYSLDELAKIENERRPPLEVRVSQRDHGWAVAA
jgi:transcriptional regulator with XRE-family HTH domain